MSIQPDLLPCPFCGSQPMILGMDRAQHPVAGCILSGRTIAAREFREWNKRTQLPDVGQLCKSTVEESPVVTPRAWTDVMGERIRQMAVEGWTPTDRRRDLIARLRTNTNPDNYDPRSLLCKYEIERIEAADALTAAQEREKVLEAALRRIDVGEGWAAQIARAALQGGQLCNSTVEMAECVAFSAGYEAGERDGLAKGGAQ